MRRLPWIMSSPQLLLVLVLGTLLVAAAAAPVARKEIPPTNVFASWFGTPRDEAPAGMGVGRRGGDAIAAAWRAPPFGHVEVAGDRVPADTATRPVAAAATTPSHDIPTTTTPSSTTSSTTTTPAPATAATLLSTRDDGDAAGEEPEDDTDCGPGLRCDGTARPLCCHSDEMFMSSDGKQGDVYNCMSEKDLCCKSGVACDRETRCADMPDDAVCCDVFERDGRPVFTFCPSPDHPELTICKDSETCVAAGAALLPTVALVVVAVVLGLAAAV